MRPEVGLNTPVMVLISVDLPAPLSPMRPTISLQPTDRLTFLSACTAPKYFCTSTKRTIFEKLLTSMVAVMSWALPSMPRAAFRHADEEFSWQQSEFEAAVGSEGMIIWSARVRKQFLLFLDKRRHRSYRPL